MFSVVIEDYAHHKSETYNFDTFKEAVEFMKKARKIFKKRYFCLNFFT